MKFPLNITGNIKDSKKKRESKRVLHVYLERHSVDYALVRYAGEEAHAELSFSVEHDQISIFDMNVLEESVLALQQHVSTSLVGDSKRKDPVFIDQINVSLSPVFITSETAEVIRIAESPQTLTSFETDLDMSGSIIHREIRDVALNGYEVSPRDAIGLVAETVSFREEVHAIDQKTFEMITSVFQKTMPGVVLNFSSSLAESTYVIERMLSPQDTWQLLHIDHDDSFLYIRDSSQTTSIRYGIDELFSQLVANNIGYDERAVLTSLRMALREHLETDVLDRLSYTLDIESSVMNDALLDAGLSLELPLYLHSPHDVVSDLLEVRFKNAFALERQYSEAGYPQEYLDVPPHVRLSMHHIASIEFLLINEHSSL